MPARFFEQRTAPRLYGRKGEAALLRSLQVGRERNWSKELSKNKFQDCSGSRQTSEGLPETPTEVWRLPLRSYSWATPKIPIHPRPQANSLALVSDCFTSSFFLRSALASGCCRLNDRP